MPVIYLSGPMTGLPENNYPAFNRVAHELRGMGFEVVNPAENNLPVNSHWRAYMRAALSSLLRCDAVVLLPGWSASRGATIERRLCVDLDIRAWAIDDVRRDPAHVINALKHSKG